MERKTIPRMKKTTTLDLKFIDYALGLAPNPYLKIKRNYYWPNYPYQFLDNYLKIFSACEIKPVNFENYDAQIVLDREGRITYYGLEAFVNANNHPLPNEDTTFFIKTSYGPMEGILKNVIDNNSNSQLVKSTKSQLVKSTKQIEWIPLKKLREKFYSTDPELINLMQSAFGENEIVPDFEIYGAEFTNDLKITKNNGVKSNILRWGVSPELIIKKLLGYTKSMQSMHWEKSENILRRGQYSFSKLEKISSYFKESRKELREIVKGSQFDDTFRYLLKNKKSLNVLLIDSSVSTGLQLMNISFLLNMLYGENINFNSFVTTRILNSHMDGSRFMDRSLSRMVPTNILNADGFEIQYNRKGKKIKQKGFMKKDKIQEGIPDNLVDKIKDVGKYLARDYKKFKNVENRKEVLTSNPDLVNTLKEISEIFDY